MRVKRQAGEAENGPVKLGGDFGRFFVPENADRLFQLLDFERFFQNRDRPLGQDPVQHLAVRISGDDDHWQPWVDLLRRFVNVVGRAIRQLQIEKEEIKSLFLERADRLFHRSDHDSAEADLLEENLEEILQTGIVVDDQDGRLARAILLQDIFIERILFNSPTATDLDRRATARAGPDNKQSAAEFGGTSQSP